MKRPKTKPALRKRRQCTWSAFGILNAYGEPWTPRTFDNAKDADAYLSEKRKNWGSKGLDRHKVVPVRVTVRIASPAKAKAAP